MAGDMLMGGAAETSPMQPPMPAAPMSPLSPLSPQAPAPTDPMLRVNQAISSQLPVKVEESNG